MAARRKNGAMGARWLAEWLFLNNEVYDPWVINKQANTVLPIQVNLLPNMQLISNMCILTKSTFNSSIGSSIKQVNTTLGNQSESYGILYLKIYVCYLFNAYN